MKFYNAMHLKRFFLTLSVLFIGYYLSAQANRTHAQDHFWERVRFGGGIGLGFGDGYFSGVLAPSAIYSFNEYVAGGIGLNGSYAREKDYFSATVLGGSLIGLFNPIPEIQLSSEFETLHVSRTFEFRDAPDIKDDYWYPALFLGAGYHTGQVTFGVRFDVLYDKNKSIYADAYMPFVRVYF